MSWDLGDRRVKAEFYQACPAEVLSESSDGGRFERFDGFERFDRFRVPVLTFTRASVNPNLEPVEPAEPVEPVEPAVIRP